MRILHLITLYSPDGAFGGPLRVALNQAVELGGRGHVVQLAGGWTSSGEPPAAVGGVQLHLFRSRRPVPRGGFSALVSPGLVWWLISHAADYDIIHVHAGRDLTSQSVMIVLALLRRKFVIQTHGMIGIDGRLRTKLVDVLWVRRLLRQATSRLVLTQREKNELSVLVGSDVSVQMMGNGVPSAGRSSVASDRGEVLFCARLHPRKRPLAFVQMAAVLVARGVQARFTIVGPDEGELHAVRGAISALGLSQFVRYDGALAYDEVLLRMARAEVYVLPSVDEPFPMSLLEALSAGVATVSTDSTGVASILLENQAGLVCDRGVDALADAVERLLGDPDLRAELSRNALHVVDTVFSLTSVCDELERTYDEVRAVR